MASAEVLQNSAAASSRKQGHLEAGKRRLEEFRKKKAEGKARKAASTGQLLSPDVIHHDKFSQDHECASNRATSEGDNATAAELSTSNPVYKDDAVASSQSTEADLSRLTQSISANNDGTSHTGHISTDLTQDESKLYRNPGFSRIMDGYYPQGREKTDLSSYRESENTNESAKGQENVLYAVLPNSTFEVKNKHSLLYPVDAQSVTQKSSGEKDKSEIFQSNPFYLQDKMRGASEQKLGLFSNSPTGGNTYTIYEDTASLEQHRRDDVNYEGLNISAKKISDSISHHLDADSEPPRLSEHYSVNSSSNFKNSSSLPPFSSTISGPSAWRSRPSFLDFLNVPRPSSISHMPSSESAKADSPVSLDSSKIQMTEVYPLSSQKPAHAAFQQSATLANADTFGGEESTLNISASLTDDQHLREVRDGEGKAVQDFSGLTKDEDFAALEQHIEDLTQEKFSLQRALESSRTLAESLAAENSSLTESFNQQGKVVNQLKSDMERLQEEIRAQLMAVEDVKMEYANAQLECNAADERSKILASEVIGLEEKALRLRSNELKLEKQLEKSNAEISSYKKKVSSLEKERQDFQSTIEALQEEKKLLQSKLRKASSNGKIIDAVKASATKKDVFTSTEDLGTESSNPVDGENATEILNAAIDAERETESAALPSSIFSSSSFQSTRSLFVPDASGVIPNDQLRMINNINSLLSELALEKEELVQELRVHTANNFKLKDMNKELSQKLETQTQRLELLTAQHMASENILHRSVQFQSTQDTTAYTDEGDEVVERVLGWIMRLFPGGPTKRRTSKLL